MEKEYRMKKVSDGGKKKMKERKVTQILFPQEHLWIYTW